MQWWEDIWLNEGFATYMSMVGVEALYPDWMSGGQFLSLVTLKAMVGDASRFTHPIHNKIEHPDEIFESFDEISYEKTAALIRYIITQSTNYSNNFHQIFVTDHRNGQLEGRIANIHGEISIRQHCFNEPVANTWRERYT